MESPSHTIETDHRCDASGHKVTVVEPAPEQATKPEVLEGDRVIEAGSPGAAVGAYREPKEERIKCSNCGNMILKVTANYQDGFCGPCFGTESEKKACKKCGRMTPKGELQHCGGICNCCLWDGLEDRIAQKLARKSEIMCQTEQRLIHVLSHATFWEEQTARVLREGGRIDIYIPFSRIAGYDAELATLLAGSRHLSPGPATDIIGALAAGQVFDKLLAVFLTLRTSAAARKDYQDTGKQDFDIGLADSDLRIGVYLQTFEKMLLQQVLDDPRPNHGRLETSLALALAAKESAEIGLGLIERKLLICALLAQVEVRDEEWRFYKRTIEDQLRQEVRTAVRGGACQPVAVWTVKAGDALVPKIQRAIDRYLIPFDFLMALADGDEFLEPMLSAMEPAAVEVSPQPDQTRRRNSRSGAHGLDAMAARQQPNLLLSDVVLSERTRREVTDLVNAIRYRDTVLKNWKLGERLDYGLGIIACFHGDSGVGKSLAARSVAGEAKMELRVVRVSQILSIWVGECEKNIDFLFDEANAQSSILLIDEADTLFTTRLAGRTASEVHLNSQINTMLSRIEQYSGVVILTTNRPTVLDQAFERRLAFRVQFDRPDATAREQIWRKMLVEPIPLAPDIAFAALADTYAITGGQIKNAVLRAAFSAAAARTSIDMATLQRAAGHAAESWQRAPMGFATRQEVVDSNEPLTKTPAPTAVGDRRRGFCNC